MSVGDKMDEIGEANLARYGSGLEVDEYVREPYHALRIRLAVSLMDRALQDRFPNVPRGQLTILELASGSGSTARLLVDMGYAVIASDAAGSAMPSSNVPGIRSIVFDVRDSFPLADGSVQGVLAGELIEHLFDPVSFLQRCRRVLMADGVLVLTTPNLAGLQDRLGFLCGRSPRHVNPLHGYLRLHIRPFTASMLRATLRAGGFFPLSLKSNYVVLRIRGKKLRIRCLARLWPTLGGSLIMSATAGPEG